MSHLTARALVADCEELFSLPDIYYQVSEMINDQRYSIEDIGQVVSKDPALSARLLRVVNSPFYGFQAKISTISRAIVVVGIDDLKNLILSTSVIDRFSHIPSELVDMTAFWMRSVHCGVICKLLAKASSVLHSERLFMTGLLHNIGSLVLYCKLPVESQNVLLAAGNDCNKIAGLEQELIGFSHAEVGGELIKSWGLPESLYEAIACYLNPHRALVHRLDAYLLFVATQLLNAAEKGIPAETAVDQIGLADLTVVRLNGKQIVAATERADEEFGRLFELMTPGKSFH